MRGELVGINLQILSPGDGNIGIGFAIPANMARHVMKELQSDGRVRRAQLGTVIQPVTSDIAESCAARRGARRHRLLRRAAVRLIAPGIRRAT